MSLSVWISPQFDRASEWGQVAIQVKQFQEISAEEPGQFHRDLGDRV
ncbi:hypothetical protein IQ250_29495 [Pseudanabaenaceae cyanobacterium LEGE 13415]|nr:hypothetical protein [Pseudanabaenaceae cyanobacterium LEGE 13415]